MTLSDFRKLTDDLSDDMELYIILGNVIYSISYSQSGIMTLKDSSDIEQEIVVLSIKGRSSKSTISLN